MGSVPPPLTLCPPGPRLLNAKRIPSNPWLFLLFGGNAHLPCLGSIMCAVRLIRIPKCKAEPLIVPLDLKVRKTKPPNLAWGEYRIYFSPRNTFEKGPSICTPHHFLPSFQILWPLKWFLFTCSEIWADWSNSPFELSC